MARRGVLMRTVTRAILAINAVDPLKKSAVTRRRQSGTLFLQESVDQ